MNRLSPKIGKVASSVAIGTTAAPSRLGQLPAAIDLESRTIIWGIDQLAHSISQSWFDLSPQGKARALELEASLSYLRRKLL